MRTYLTDEEERFANDCNISREIAQAICEYRKTRQGRDRVWANPTKREEKKIIARAWQLADEEETELFWCDTITRK